MSGKGPLALSRPLAKAICLVLMCMSVLHCQPSFEDDDACASNADCFADQVCTQGECVAGSGDVSPEPVNIVEFVSSESELLAEESATLSWTLEHAKSATITSDDASFSYDIPQADLDSGNTSVMVDKTLTFTLAALGEEDGDETSSTVKINFKEPEPMETLPVIDAFSASDAVVMPDSSVTLSWTMTDVDRAELSDGSTTTELTGDDLSDGSAMFTPSTSTSYTLTAYNEERVTMRSLQVIVQGESPTISTFEASASRIEQGSDVTLSWDVIGATSLSITDEGGAEVDISSLMLSMDSVAQTIIQNKSYTLTASNAFGQDAQTVSVISYEPLSIDTFEASSSPVDAGADSTLSWSISGVPSSVVITSDTSTEPLDLSGASLAAGTVLVSVDTPTTYTLTAQNSDGDEQTATVLVDVFPPDPVIQLFDAANDLVVAGTDVTLNWNVTGATMLTLMDDSGVMTDISNKLTNIDFIDVTVTQDTIYTLTASNSGGSVSADVTVSVGAPVTAMLSSDVATVNAGGDVTLSWTTSNATALELTSSLGATIDLTGKSLAADSVLVSPGSDVTYTLTAQGFAGPVTSEVMVTVEPIVRINAFETSATIISQGDMITLNWDIEHSTSYTLEAVDSMGTTQIDTSALGVVDSIMLSPTETTTYRLSAVGDMADTDTLDLLVTVSAPPTIDSFIASPDTISTTLSQVSTLSWTTTNTTSVFLLDLSSGMPVPFTDLGGGAGQVDVMPGMTTTYLLDVQSASNEMASQMLTVTVIP